MITYINTNELDKISDELIFAADELTGEINNLYDRLTKVPNVTREWVGNQANYYFSRINMDRKQYIEFSNKIRALGKEVKVVASSSRNHIKNNNKQGD